MRTFMNKSNALVLITEPDQFIKRYHPLKTDLMNIKESVLVDYSLV